MNLELTRVFVKVVQCGSFSKAAELLKLPKSTVSKSISRLESESGTRLLVRTTRSLTTTAAGRAFFDSCRGPIQSLEDAQKSLDGQDSVISGLVRITAPEDLGGHVIAPALSVLVRKHPQLSFEMHYTDSVIDLVRDGFDLAVRIGKLTESGLKAKRVGEIVLVMVASPNYLKAASKIRVPKDLESHDCLTLSRGVEWWLKSGAEKVLIPIKSRMLSNQMTSLLQAAVAGAGVALVPQFICRSDIQSGRLVRVLPEWASPGLPVSMLSPISTGSAARLKLTSDHIFSAIQKTLKN